MHKYVAEIIICCVTVATVVLLFIINKVFSSLVIVQQISPEFSWFVHGVQNVLGYSTVLLPGYFILRYTRKINYLERPSSSTFRYLVKLCFGYEGLPEHSAPSPSAQGATRTFYNDALLLIFYFLGLQVSYLTWGVLQEKVMTQDYRNSSGDIEKFKDSQFLVFINRVLAFSLSGLMIICTRQSRHKAPLYKYIFCSLSNIMSSWCQYEALKYVSFLHQVLAKAAKTIPVMIMGKFVMKTKYEFYEYITTFILSMGMLFFMFNSGDDMKSSSSSTFFGIVLLCSYVAFDSFTSNWQGSLFKNYGMSSLQMMCAVNFFSCILTFSSLLQQGNLINSFSFIKKFPKFGFDCILLSICSAVGQLFIFGTISTFGPLIFAIISTIRQGFSIFLSCIIYNHHINSIAIFGVFLVFFSIFLRIYCSYRIRTKKKVTSNDKF